MTAFETVELILIVLGGVTAMAASVAYSSALPNTQPINHLKWIFDEPARKIRRGGWTNSPVYPATFGGTYQGRALEIGLLLKDSLLLRKPVTDRLDFKMHTSFTGSFVLIEANAAEGTQPSVLKQLNSQDNLKPLHTLEPLLDRIISIRSDDPAAFLTAIRRDDLLQGLGMLFLKNNVRYLICYENELIATVIEPVPSDMSEDNAREISDFMVELVSELERSAPKELRSGL